MSVLSLPILSSISAFHSPQSSFADSPSIGHRVGGTRRIIASRFVAASNILKANRLGSPYGKPISIRDTDEGFECEEDVDDDVLPWFADPDEEFAEPADLDADHRRTKLLIASKNRREKQVRRGRTGSLKADGIDELEGNVLGNNRYGLLSEEIALDKAWIPLLDYLRTFGLTDSHLIQMYERHKSSFRVNVCSARERLGYLLDVGVKHKDIRKILLRQPQILEYTVRGHLESHVAFLADLGIPDSRIGNVVAAAPSLFSYSVKNSLKPTAEYLVEEVGIMEKDLSKVIQLSPQILIQRVDTLWNDRYGFLSEELGAPRDNVVKMITKHPQLLHYSIQDGLLPRINFLRSIGLQNNDILKVLTSLTQVFSLSLEKNLRPKYHYLINELQNEVKSLTKYPTYLSLSLNQRIRPRHRFLVFLNKADGGPFPLRSLVPSDECFCKQWAGTSVDDYLAFRQRLLIQDFANKYKRQG